MPEAVEVGLGVTTRPKPPGLRVLVRVAGEIVKTPNKEASTLGNFVLVAGTEIIDLNLGFT